jgi:Methyltransferase domain
MNRHSLAMLHPTIWKPAIKAARALWFDYAHLRTVLTRSCVDSRQQPVPWYTYPAIEYLKSLDFSDKTIFEYGSGNSTLFWAARAKRVVSVEDDDAWYARIAPQLPANCEIRLDEDLASYADTIRRYPEPFDVIVVDGAARGGTRLRCSRNALAALRPGGMIILDNSDWLPESARLLRESGLIQVDMTGFAPICGHTQSTSVFLHREFNFAPCGERQPLPGPASVPNVWEHPPSWQPPVVEMDGEVFGGVVRNDAFGFDTPAGRRRFAFIVSRVDDLPFTTVAILDLDQQRVLISVAEPADGASVTAELARATTLSWEEFRSLINRHGKKRYRLPETLPAPSGTLSATA